METSASEFSFSITETNSPLSGEGDDEPVIISVQKQKIIIGIFHTF